MMKANRVKLLSIFFASGLCFASEVNNSRVIVLRSDPWCPYACKEGDNPGVIVEIAQMAFREIGYKVDYKTMSWARALHQARTGKIDGLASCTPENSPEFILPKEALALGSSAFFTKSNNSWNFKTIDDIKSMRIGVINGYTYDDTTNLLIANKHPSYKILSGEEPLKSLIGMLNRGRIDAIYENVDVFNMYLRLNKYNPSDFKEAGWPQQKMQKVSICFSPKLQEAKFLSEVIAEKLNKMKADGSYKTLLNKYGIKSLSQ